MPLARQDFMRARWTWRIRAAKKSHGKKNHHHRWGSGRPLRGVLRTHERLRGGHLRDAHASRRLRTTWKRGDFLFDGCIHWLSGSGPKSSFHKYWQELGVLKGRHIIDHDVFYRVVGADGRELTLYADADRLERHIVELSPADAEPAAALRRMVKAFASHSLLPDKAMELMGPLDMARRGLRRRRS